MFQNDPEGEFKESAVTTDAAETEQFIETFGSINKAVVFDSE